MAVSSSQGMPFSLQDVWRGKRNRYGTLRGQSRLMQIGESCMDSRSSEMSSSSEIHLLPRSFAELIQIRSEKTAWSLKLNVLAAYSAKVV